jgi:hypothetical protein
VSRAHVALALAFGCGGVGSRSEPAISSLTPSSGPAQGGIMVTIAGTDLTDATTMPIVLVGATQATVVSSTPAQVVFALPPGVPESAVDVTISDAHGFATDSGAFTYNPLPLALAIAPPGGPVAGGTTITITGQGFSNFNAGPVAVTIGSAAATNVTVVSDQLLTAVTGAQPASVPPFTPLDVVVTDANGSATLLKAFSTTKQGLLMLSRNDLSLSYFDPTTSNTTSLNTTAAHLHGCALGSNGLLYATGRGLNNGIGTLFTFDPLTGSATAIGTTTDVGNGSQYAVTSMVFVGPTLYGFVDGPNGNAVKRLVTLNLATGSATLIGATPVTAATTRGMTIGSRDLNTVFYAEVTSGTLDTLSLTTSARTTGPQMSGGQAQRARAMASFNGMLYLLEEGNPATLYTVDPVGGALTQVATVVNGGISLCRTPPSF